MMNKVIAHKKELLKYHKDRNELFELIDNNKCKEPYINICGFIIPISKVYVCTELKRELNFEKVIWLVR